MRMEVMNTAMNAATPFDMPTYSRRLHMGYSITAKIEENSSGTTTILRWSAMYTTKIIIRRLHAERITWAVLALLI